MNNLTLSKGQRLAIALLESAQTNAQIMDVLRILRAKIAPEDAALTKAIEMAEAQLDSQLDKLEEFFRG